MAFQSWCLFTGKLGVEAAHGNAKRLQNRHWVLNVHRKCRLANAPKLHHNIGRYKSAANHNRTIVLMHDLEILDAGHGDAAIEIEHIRVRLCRHYYYFC
jgi:hypothetical protein